MLRAVNRVRTPTVTGTSLTVTHALGAVPDFWAITALSARSQNRTYVVGGPATVLTNLITICNSLQSNCTCDVFTVNYQGRLY